MRKLFGNAGKEVPGAPRDELSSRRLLKVYGLDRLLEAEDDPRLWAASVCRYWPMPDDRKFGKVRLSFGVGDEAAIGLGPMLRQMVYMGDDKTGEFAEGGYIRLYELEPGSGGRLRAIPPEQVSARARSETLYLDISRPTSAAERATVHYGFSAHSKQVWGSYGGGSDYLWQWVWKKGYGYWTEKECGEKSWMI